MKLADDRLIQYRTKPRYEADADESSASELAEGVASLPRLSPSPQGRLPEGPPPDSPYEVAATAPLSFSTRFRLRLLAEQTPDRVPDLLDHPAAVADFFWFKVHDRPQEVVYAAYLDTRHRLIGWQEVFVGSRDRCHTEPAPILQTALLANAASFVLCHNHPSGDPSPSTEDVLFTERLRKAGKLVGVDLADSVILGDGGRWYSIKRGHRW